MAIDVTDASSKSGTVGRVRRTLLCANSIHQSVTSVADTCILGGAVVAVGDARNTASQCWEVCLAADTLTVADHPASCVAVGTTAENSVSHLGMRTSTVSAVPNQSACAGSLRDA